MSGEKTKTTHTLKILTWNVRGLRQEDRTREILRDVGNQGNDIIMLQETHFRNEREGGLQFRGSGRGVPRCGRINQTEWVE